MNNVAFHNKIRETIEKCSYEFYIVSPIISVMCTCVNHATKQPSPDCINCLGTGYKIRIKKIKGASNEIEASVTGKGVRGSAAKGIARTYFVDAKYDMKDNDLIIDNDMIFYAYRIIKMKALEGVHTHNQIKAIQKKNDHNITLKNFKKIMSRYKG